MDRRKVAGFILCLAAVAGALQMSGCFRGEGMTPLMLAAHDGNIPALKERIAAGDDLNARSRYSWTPLMFAAWKGHREQVVALLDAGADPDLESGVVPSAFETVGGWPPTTALREAVRARHFGIARLLVSRGATVDAKSVGLAAERADAGLLEELAGRCAEWKGATGDEVRAEALADAAGAGKVANLEWLVRQEADPDRIVHGETALKEAVDDDQVEAVRFLLEHGANPNVIFRSSRETALSSAVSKHTETPRFDRNAAVIRLLLKHGADRDHRPFDGDESIVDIARRRRDSGRKSVAEATDPVVRGRLEAYLGHEEAVLGLLER